MVPNITWIPFCTRSEATASLVYRAKARLTRVDPVSPEFLRAHREIQRSHSFLLLHTLLLFPSIPVFFWSLLSETEINPIRAKLSGYRNDTTRTLFRIRRALEITGHRGWEMDTRGNKGNA